MDYQPDVVYSTREMARTRFPRHASPFVLSLALPLASALPLTGCAEGESPGGGGTPAHGGSGTGGDPTAGGRGGSTPQGGAGGEAQGGAAGSGAAAGMGGAAGAGGSAGHGGAAAACVIDSPPTPIVTADPSHAPQLLATDAGFALVWQEATANGSLVTLATLDADLAVTSGPTAVPDGSAESASAHASSSGAEIGLAWVDQRDAQDDLYFARFSSAGTKIGSDLAIAVGAEGAESSPAIDWGYDSWGLVWIHSPDIHQAEVSALGELEWVDTSWHGSAEWVYDHPAIASIGIDWIILVGAEANGSQSAFYRAGSSLPELLSLNYRPNVRASMTVSGIESRFAYTTASGAMGLGQSILDDLAFVTDAGSVAPGLALVWTGAHFVTANATTGGELRITRYGFDLTALDESTIVDDAVEGAPSMVQIGNDFLVAYADESSGDIQIVAVRCD